jgi:tRNA(adenine34) deaminase
MEWKEVPYIWQECFKEAWVSFQEGSRPVGAIVINDEGEIVARGKSSTFNEISNSVISNNELAHAEVNALLKLDNRIHRKVASYVLYSTLEPCPLCFGAFYMSGIRNLEYAAKDKYGGSTNLRNTTPYLSRKPIKINGPVSYLENLSILLNVYFERLIDYPSQVVLEKITEDYPETINLANSWFEEQKLKNAHQLTIEDVFEMMIIDLSLPSNILI